jgi:hypothetical protein
LHHGARGEGLDVDVAAGAGVVLFVPAWEGREEEEGDEGEDDGDDSVSNKGGQYSLSSRFNPIYFLCEKMRKHSH